MPTNFKSDNVTAACPEVMEALLRANADEAVNSYGGTVGGTLDDPDPSTLRMNQLFAETFECEVEVFPVVGSNTCTGLAAALDVVSQGFLTPRAMATAAAAAAAAAAAVRPASVTRRPPGLLRTCSRWLL